MPPESVHLLLALSGQFGSRIGSVSEIFILFRRIFAAQAAQTGTCCSLQGEQQEQPDGEIAIEPTSRANIRNRRITRSGYVAGISVVVSCPCIEKHNALTLISPAKCLEAMEI